MNARVWASILVCVTLSAAPAVAANGNGKGKDHKSTPPSRTVLPAPAIAGPAPTAGASPLAWIDDASVVAPGAMSLSISVFRWQGADLSQVDAPIVDVSAGLAPRVQFGASIPHVVGSDTAGIVGGVGTSFVSAKVAVLKGARGGVKLAVAPTLEILGSSAIQEGARRTQFGVPVSAEIEQGPARIFGSAGYFTGGIWFAGAGVGAAVSPRVAVSVSLSRAWTTEGAVGPARDRKELSGGAAFTVTPRVAVFASVGRTLATTDANGAGTTIGGGVSFTVSR